MNVRREVAPLAFANPTTMSVVDGGVDWRKSRRSQTSNCVEAGVLPGAVEMGIRDSKDPEGPILRVSPASFRALTACVANGTIAKPEIA